jgi:hypothetical protein
MQLDPTEGRESRRQAPDGRGLPADATVTSIRARAHPEAGAAEPSLIADRATVGES